MCLILFGNINNIKKLDLDLAWKCNNDGAGIIILGNPAQTIKGLMKQKAFNREIKRIPAGSSVAVHLRKATHGAVTKQWCHPFSAGHNCWIMHNGVFGSLGKFGKDGISDSAHLAIILSYMPLDQKISLLSQIVGYNNRILLIKENTYMTFGTWSEHDNIKMSNPLLIPTVPHTYTGSVIAQIGFNQNSWSQKYGKQIFKNGKWIDDSAEYIIEESKHFIDSPAAAAPNSTDQAALPFRKSEIAKLFDPDTDTEEDKAFDRYLRQRTWDGD